MLARSRAFGGTLTRPGAASISWSDAVGAACYVSYTYLSLTVQQPFAGRHALSDSLLSAATAAVALSCMRRRCDVISVTHSRTTPERLSNKTFISVSLVISRTQCLPAVHSLFPTLD